MNVEVRRLIDEYFQWLKDRTVLTEISGGSKWVKITTPHLDRHNDYLQFYLQEKNGGYLLTDDGVIIEDLETTGCELVSPKRKKLLETTLAGFGVQLQGNSLIIQATKENFPLKKHSLIQAMLAVNDLFYLASPHVASLFFEDVVGWLDLNEVRYTPRVKFAGKSGYDHMFDFVIPKFRDAPERLVQTISNPNPNNAKSLAFSWVDTKENREPNSKLFAFLNDSSHSVKPGFLEALKNYGVQPVLWSQREALKQDVAYPPPLTLNRL